MFGDGKVKTTSGISEEEEEDDEASIDLDDRLYFPPEEKEIDISKNIRDMVHVEITINAICDPSCKGLCLNCGTNLNTSSCSCRKEEVKEKSYPLANLKNQMQRTWGEVKWYGVPLEVVLLFNIPSFSFLIWLWLKELTDILEEDKRLVDNFHDASPLDQQLWCMKIFPT
jgi:hypothetical protein